MLAQPFASLSNHAVDPSLSEGKVRRGVFRAGATP